MTDRPNPDPVQTSSPSAPTPTPSRSPLLLAALLAAVGITGAVLSFTNTSTALAALREQVVELRGQTRELTDRIELFRLENDAEGRGVDAVLERVRHFAEGLGTAIAPEEIKIKERLENALRALETIGPAASDAIIAAFDSEKDDRVRNWFLIGLLRADPKRGKLVATQTVRATDHHPSETLRVYAARQLRLHDRKLAAQVLEEVLLFSSERGVVRERVPPQLAEEYADIALQATQMNNAFHNLVQNYLDCEPENAGRTLTQIIGRPEGQVTIQKCVKALGELEHRPAVGRIMELYERPPGAFASPLFKQTCLRSLAQILGSEMCSFLESELLTEQDQTVRVLLTDLHKRHCGG